MEPLRNLYGKPLSVISFLLVDYQMHRGCNFSKKIGYVFGNKTLWQ